MGKNAPEVLAISLRVLSLYFVMEYVLASREPMFERIWKILPRYFSTASI